MSVLWSVYMKEKLMTMYIVLMLVLFNNCLSHGVLLEISKYKTIRRFKVIKNATKAGVQLLLTSSQLPSHLDTVTLYMSSQLPSRLDTVTL